MAQNGMDAFMGSLATFQGLQDNSRKWELQAAANRRADANEPRLDQATRIANEQNQRAAAEEKRKAEAAPGILKNQEAVTAQTELATEKDAYEFGLKQDGEKSKIVYGQAVDFGYFNPVDMAMTPKFQEDLMSENPQIQQRALGWLAQSGNSLLTPNSDAIVTGVNIADGQIRLTTTNKKDGSKSSLTEDTSNDPNAKVLSLTINQANDLLNTHMVGTVNRQANPQYDATRRSLAQQTLEVIADTQVQLSQADPQAGRSFAGMLVDTTPEEKTEIANQALEAQGLPPLQGPEQPQPQLGEAIAPEPFVSDRDTQAAREYEMGLDEERIQTETSIISDYLTTGKRSIPAQPVGVADLAQSVTAAGKDPYLNNTNLSKSFRTLHRNANKNSKTTPEVFEEATGFVGWYAKNEVELSKRIQSNPAVMDEIEKIGATEFARKYQSLDLSTPEDSTVLEMNSAVNQATGGTADGARDAAANGNFPKSTEAQLSDIRSMVGLAGVSTSNGESIQSQIASKLNNPQRIALIAAAVGYANTNEEGQKILDANINLFTTGDAGTSQYDVEDLKIRQRANEASGARSQVSMLNYLETVKNNRVARDQAASEDVMAANEFLDKFQDSLVDPASGMTRTTDNTLMALKSLGRATNVPGKIGDVATEYFVPSVIDYLKVKSSEGGFSQTTFDWLAFWRDDPKLQGGVGKSSQDVRVLLTKDGGLKALVIQDSSGANRELEGKEVLQLLDDETVRLLIAQAKQNKKNATK